MAPDDATVTPRYAWSRLGRAIETATSHPDAEVRARAEAKAARWRDVIAGMADGRLAVGSRTPVAGTPAWVTLEVAHGGFATGRLLAERPPDEDEVALLRSLGDGPGRTDRERLNLWYLSDAGQAVLADALRSGRFRAGLPEEAALLVVTWLLENDRPGDALDLVTELRPFLARLRFTPSFVAERRPAEATVRLRTAGEVAATLAAVRTPAQIAAMRTTLDVWHPLFDRLLALWCDTVEGDLPRLVPAGGPDAGAVAGGWPCRTWPADWAERRASWLADHRRALARHDASARQRSPKSDFARLAAALERCENGSEALTGRDVGWVRRAIANTVTRHGEPGSDRREALRATQAAVVAAPTHAAVAGVVGRRLRRYPADGGIPELAPVVAPVTGDESDEAAGTPVPAHLAAKAARALEAPVAELVERGVIPSADVLAAVLPQITANVMAADAGDERLSEVLRQTYAAFRRRRSLLLLNYASQVRFEELPWVAVVRPPSPAGSRHGAGAARTARLALAESTLLAWQAFPHAVVPNPLVKELRALSERAGLSLPLVDEIAADIFMGDFTDTWRRAAAVASDVTAGTLYARYYDLPAPGRWDAPPPERRGGLLRRNAQLPSGFGEACRERAAEARSDGPRSWVAENGIVLEQSQILTTQNLAVLASALDARERLAATGAGLAARALGRAVRELDLRRPDGHSELIALKNAAYAWRQALFFLGFCDAAAQERVVERLRERTAAARFGPATRLAPAVDGLAHVVAGGRFDAAGRVPAGSGGPGGRRLLGWSLGRHWLSAARTPDGSA
jgi:hypothetical protein